MSYQTEYKGRIYPTKKAAIYAADKELKYSCVVSWINAHNLRHLPLDEAISLYRQRPRQDRLPDVEVELTYKGKTYQNRRLLCADLNISLACLKFGLYRGMSLSETVFRAKKVRARQIESRTDHKGIVYKSQKAMCEAYGINPARYRDRIKYHRTKEEALTMPLKTYGTISKQSDVIDHLGNHYASTSEMCRAYNIIRETYLYRRFVRQMSVKDALTVPVREHKFR